MWLSWVEGIHHAYDEARTFEDVLRHLREASGIKGVVQADSMFGRFDAIVTIEAPDLESLSETVYKVIEMVPNVIHTETAIVLSSMKK